VTTPPLPPRRALGRGLDALLPSAPSASTGNNGPSSANGGAAAGERLAFLCALEKLVPQKGQPRRHFDPQALDELAQSIKEHGLLEPIVVRRVSNQGGQADRFEIIAGERRWRASQKAGLRDALVVVKDVSPEVAFELALVENVQREDLNAVEIAEALDRLIKEHGYTQETVAARVGKERSTVTNHLRLLKLPAEVRDRIVTRELSEGHARALLGAKDEEQIRKLAEKVVRGKLSVRATEALVRSAGAAKDGKSGAKAGASGSSGGGSTPAIRDLEAKLGRALGIRCEVRDKGNKGEIAIPYADLDQLDRILEKLL
jgi:ParB family chromosome partitioning protein